jgi:CRP/FNR family cyclic AMP-dependent transcriptional regulator
VRAFHSSVEFERPWTGTLQPGLSDSARLFLESCLWPRSLTHEDRQAAVASLKERAYRPGALVCRRGEIAAHWVGVIEGFVRVQDATDDGRPIMYTGVAAGGWVGEGSLLKAEPLKYEIIATRDTRTLEMPYATFAQLVEMSMPFNRFPSSASE